MIIVFLYQAVFAVKLARVFCIPQNSCIFASDYESQ